MLRERSEAKQKSPPYISLLVYMYRNIYLYWIYAANNLASMLKVYVDIGYIMPKVWG